MKIQITSGKKQILAEIKGLREDIMALSAAVLAAVAALKQQIADGVTGIRSDIDSLKALVSSGASEADILAALDELKTSANAITELDGENPANSGGNTPV